MFMLTWPKYLDILLFLICFSGATFLSSQTNAIKYQSSNQSALGSNMSSLKGVFGTLGNPGNIAQSNTSFSFLATSFASIRLAVRDHILSSTRSSNKLSHRYSKAPTFKLQLTYTVLLK